MLDFEVLGLQRREVTIPSLEDSSSLVHSTNVSVIAVVLAVETEQPNTLNPRKTHVFENIPYLI